MDYALMVPWHVEYCMMNENKTKNVVRSYMKEYASANNYREISHPNWSYETQWKVCDFITYRTFLYQNKWIIHQQMIETLTNEYIITSKAWWMIINEAKATTTENLTEAGKND